MITRYGCLRRSSRVCVFLGRVGHGTGSVCGFLEQCEIKRRIWRALCHFAYVVHRDGVKDFPLDDGEGECGGWDGKFLTLMIPKTGHLVFSWLVIFLAVFFIFSYWGGEDDV